MLEDRIKLSDQFSLSFSIGTSEKKSGFSYSTMASSMSLVVNSESLKNELEQKPSKTGILVSIGDHSSPDVYLEIDIKKSR